MGNICPGFPGGGGGGGEEEDTPIGSGNFKIELEYGGSLTAEQKEVFTKAANRWSRIIKADNITPVNMGGRRIEGLLIQASGVRIDGTGAVLGRAGPTAIRASSGIIPYTGIMEFDTADLASLQRNGTLDDVILHEMGHVLGIGTLWQRKGLLAGSGTNDPTFLGRNANGEYATLLGESRPRQIPVANTGGPGTREGHWRESVFDEELMTGLAERRDMPLSRMTIASLIDLGYMVDLSAADPYSLPRRAAVTGTAPAAKTEDRYLCGVTFPEVQGGKAKSGCLCCG